MTAKKKAPMVDEGFIGKSPRRRDGCWEIINNEPEKPRETP